MAVELTDAFAQLHCQYYTMPMRLGPTEAVPRVIGPHRIDAAPPQREQARNDPSIPFGETIAPTVRPIQSTGLVVPDKPCRDE